MLKWAQMSDFSLSLPDQPGELARLAARLRAADVNLVGLWGYGSSNGGAGGGTGGAGEARFYCVPESAEQFRNFLASIELEAEEGTTFYLSGRDTIGALVKTLEELANADINLRAIQCTSFDGEFGCFIWTDPQDWKKLIAMLG